MAQRGTSKLSNTALKHDSYQLVYLDGGYLSYTFENVKEKEASKILSFS